MAVDNRRFAKIFPRNDKLRKIINKHGEYFQVITHPKPIPELNNQLGVTLADENITFTTAVTKLRMIQRD